MNWKGRKLYIAVAVFVVILALVVVVILATRPHFVTVVIPPGLRKEETAAILTEDLHWTSMQEETFMSASTSDDYAEGVYFPDTYLIPPDEMPITTVSRLAGNFNLKFSSYQKAALAKNIKWTVLLTMASIIQREAADSNDMALISGILWNRLDTKMPLDVDSTVQYARGDTGNGWWAPLAVTDLKIVSPYNTYIHTGLPPHPIDSPGLDAIDAALNPQKTDCLYYLHDSSRVIHCAATYEEHQANVKEYLQ
jgi:UPF0755 protein